MMNKLLLILAICVGISYGALNDRTVGFGVMIGEPTGLNLKLWQNSRNAIDFGLAWSFSDNGSFHLHGDYLYHQYNVFPVRSGVLPFYFGVGGRLRTEEKHDTKLGVRIPLGLAYYFRDIPLDIFFEIAPIVNIIPDTELNGNVVFGVRFLF